MKKPAKTEYPIIDLLKNRWSPLAYGDTPVTSEQIGSLMEAARWAPSCFNEQPWRFLMATKSDSDNFDKLASCLVDGNAWAKNAPLLMLSVARDDFAKNGKDNRHAEHDVGLAVSCLVMQAESMGLVVHQMGGFDSDKAKNVLEIPDGFTPMAMIAIGQPGDVDSLEPEQQEREKAPRQRRSLDEIAFGATWEKSYFAS